MSPCSAWKPDFSVAKVWIFMLARWMMYAEVIGFLQCMVQSSNHCNPLCRVKLVEHVAEVCWSVHALAFAIAVQCTDCCVWHYIFKSQPDSLLLAATSSWFLEWWSRFRSGLGLNARMKVEQEKVWLMHDTCRFSHEHSHPIARSSYARLWVDHHIRIRSFA